MPEANENLVGMSADIVSAYVANNSVTPADLADLISSVYASLSRLGRAPEATAAEPLVPAVAIKKSVTPDYLICLEDGLKFKSLKRHLGSKYGMSPAEYRVKWGLPVDYPMVAPAYAEARSQIAKTRGLGRKAATAPARARRAAKARS